MSIILHKVLRMIATTLSHPIYGYRWALYLSVNIIYTCVLGTKACLEFYYLKRIHKEQLVLRDNISMYCSEFSFRILLLFSLIVKAKNAYDWFSYYIASDLIRSHCITFFLKYYTQSRKRKKFKKRGWKTSTMSSGIENFAVFHGELLRKTYK